VTSCSQLQPVGLASPSWPTATGRCWEEAQLQPEVQLLAVVVWLSYSFFSVAPTGPHKTSFLSDTSTAAACAGLLVLAMIHALTSP
jgi:hypothetical protein